MKNQLEIREASVELLEKENGKEHAQNQNVCVEIAKLKSEATDTANLQKHLSECQQKCETKENKLKEVKSKFRNRSKSFNKMLEKLDRKEEQLTKFKAKHEEQSIKLKQSAKEIKTVNEKNGKLNKSLREEEGKTQKLKKSLVYYKDNASRHIKDLIVEKDDEIELLQEQLKELKLEKGGLQALLDISESDKVRTFENGRYVNGIREIYIKFLGMNIGRNNVGPVIESVLEQFTNIRLEGPLPSAATTGNLFAEAQILAKSQAAMAIAENKNSSLHYAKTSKYGRETGSIQVTAGGKSYATGLFDEDIGTAERLFDSIKNCLEKTAEHLTKVKKTDQLPKMLLNLKNNMTDRHSVNDYVDDLLEQWKIEIAKVTIDGFSEMNENEKKIFTSINRLRYSLHFFLGLADAAEKGLLEYDKIIRNGPLVSNCRISGESNTTRTIRTICKAFQKHGSEQAGAMAPFGIHL